MTVFQIDSFKQEDYNKSEISEYDLRGAAFMQQAEYYTISHLVQFTELTDRTIRNYISSGILQGEKVDGSWRFTSEQTEEFIRHPSVRPSILAKKNSLVYDFLLDDHKVAQEICLIMDIPRTDKTAISEFFGCLINEGNYRKIQFSYDGVPDTARIILKGDAAEVLQLADKYRQEYHA